MFEQDLEEKNIEIENNVDIQPNKESKKELSFVKKLALFLTGCVGFEIIGFIVSLIVVLLVGTDAAQTPEVTGIINFICYGSLFVILVAILNKDIVKLFSSFTKGRNYLFGIVFAAVCFAAIHPLLGFLGAGFTLTGLSCVLGGGMLGDLWAWTDIAAIKISVTTR